MNQNADKRHVKSMFSNSNTAKNKLKDFEFHLGFSNWSTQSKKNLEFRIFEKS